MRKVPSKASETAIKACRLFRCPDCPRLREPKKPRPSKLPLTDEFNVLIGIDVFQEKDSQGEAWTFLNVFCQGDIPLRTRPRQPSLKLLAPVGRKGGFSPAQWVLGRDVRLPASLADDGEVARIGAQALADTPGTKFHRRAQLRFAAREAFAKASNDAPLRRAEPRKVRPARGHPCLLLRRRCQGAWAELLARSGSWAERAAGLSGCRTGHSFGSAWQWAASQWRRRSRGSTAGHTSPDDRRPIRRP